MGRVSQSTRDRAFAAAKACKRNRPYGNLVPWACFFAIGGVLFRRKAEITIVPEGDAAAGPVPGQASRAPALGRLHEEWQNSMAVPTRDQRAAGPVPLFAQLHRTSLVLLPSAGAQYGSGDTPLAFWKEWWYTVCCEKRIGNRCLQGRVKFPIGGIVRERACADPV